MVEDRRKRKKKHPEPGGKPVTGLGQTRPENSIPPKGNVMASEAAEPAAADQRLATDIPPAAEEASMIRTDVSSDEGVIELLGFKLGAEGYAFKVEDVEEILRDQRISMFPRTFDFIIGVTSLRGTIVPVVDLYRRLSIKSADDEGAKKKRMLVLRGPKGPIGAMLCGDMGIISLAAGDMKEPPANLSESQAGYIKSVAVTGKGVYSVIRTNVLFDFNATVEAK